MMFARDPQQRALTWKEGLEIADADHYARRRWTIPHRSPKCSQSFHNSDGVC